MVFFPHCINRIKAGCAEAIRWITTTNTQISLCTKKQCIRFKSKKRSIDKAPHNRQVQCIIRVVYLKLVSGVNHCGFYVLCLRFAYVLSDVLASCPPRARFRDFSAIWSFRFWCAQSHRNYFVINGGDYILSVVDACKGGGSANVQLLHRWCLLLCAMNGKFKPREMMGRLGHQWMRVIHFARHFCGWICSLKVDCV